MLKKGKKHALFLQKIILQMELKGRKRNKFAVEKRKKTPFQVISITVPPIFTMEPWGPVGGHHSPATQRLESAPWCCVGNVAFPSLVAASIKTLHSISNGVFSQNISGVKPCIVQKKYLGELDQPNKNSFTNLIFFLWIWWWKTITNLRWPGW